MEFTEYRQNGKSKPSMKYVIRRNYNTDVENKTGRVSCYRNGVLKYSAVDDGQWSITKCLSKSNLKPKKKVHVEQTVIQHSIKDWAHSVPKFGDNSAVKNNNSKFFYRSNSVANQREHKPKKKVQIVQNSAQHSVKNLAQSTAKLNDDKIIIQNDNRKLSDELHSEANQYGCGIKIIAIKRGNLSKKDKTLSTKRDGSEPKILKFEGNKLVEKTNNTSSNKPCEIVTKISEARNILPSAYKSLKVNNPKFEFSKVAEKTNNSSVKRCETITKISQNYAANIRTLKANEPVTLKRIKRKRQVPKCMKFQIVLPKLELDMKLTRGGDDTYLSEELLSLLAKEIPFVGFSAVNFEKSKNKCTEFQRAIRKITSTKVKSISENDFNLQNPNLAVKRMDKQQTVPVPRFIKPNKRLIHDCLVPRAIKNHFLNNSGNKRSRNDVEILSDNSESDSSQSKRKCREGNPRRNGRKQYSGRKKLLHSPVHIKKIVSRIGFRSKVVFLKTGSAGYQKFMEKKHKIENNTEVNIEKSAQIVCPTKDDVQEQKIKGCKEIIKAEQPLRRSERYQLKKNKGLEIIKSQNNLEVNVQKPREFVLPTNDVVQEQEQNNVACKRITDQSLRRSQRYQSKRIKDLEIMKNLSRNNIEENVKKPVKLGCRTINDGRQTRKIAELEVDDQPLSQRYQKRNIRNNFRVNIEKSNQFARRNKDGVKRKQRVVRDCKRIIGADRPLLKSKRCRIRREESSFQDSESNEDDFGFLPFEAVFLPQTTAIPCWSVKYEPSCTDEIDDNDQLMYDFGTYDACNIKNVESLCITNTEIFADVPFETIYLDEYNEIDIKQEEEDVYDCINSELQFSIKTDIKTEAEHFIETPPIYIESIPTNQPIKLEADDGNTKLSDDLIYKHYCAGCTRQFTNDSDLLQHLITDHYHNSYCDICRRRVLKRKCHMSRHAIFTPFTCKYCNKSFFQKDWLEKHEMTHIPKVHKCPYCNKSFFGECYLSNHKPHCAKKNNSRCNVKNSSNNGKKIEQKVIQNIGNNFNKLNRSNNTEMDHADLELENRSLDPNSGNLAETPSDLQNFFKKLISKSDNNVDQPKRDLHIDDLVLTKNVNPKIHSNDFEKSNNFKKLDNLEHCKLSKSSKAKILINKKRRRRKNLHYCHHKKKTKLLGEKVEKHSVVAEKKFEHSQKNFHKKKAKLLGENVEKHSVVAEKKFEQSEKNFGTNFNLKIIEKQKSCDKKCNDAKILNSSLDQNGKIKNYKTVNDGNVKVDLKNQSVFAKKKRAATLMCPICNKGFYSNKSLDKHLNWHNRKKIRINCNMCDKYFFHQIYFDEHLNWHLLQETEKKLESSVPYNEVEEGNLEFTKNQLNNKLSNDNTYNTDLESGRQCRCLICNLKFTRLDKFFKHIKTHKNEDNNSDNSDEGIKCHAYNQNLFCSICSMIFLNEEDFICHMHSHKYDKNRYCPVCNKNKFRSPTEFSKHIKIHINHAELFNDINNKINNTENFENSIKLSADFDKRRKKILKCTDINCALVDKNGIKICNFIGEESKNKTLDVTNNIDHLKNDNANYKHPNLNKLTDSCKNVNNVGVTNLNYLNSNMVTDLCKDMNSYDAGVTNLNNSLNSNMLTNSCKNVNNAAITNLNYLNSNMVTDLCKDMNSYDDDKVTDLNNCLNSNMLPDLCKDMNSYDDDEVTDLNNCLNSNMLPDLCKDMNSYDDDEVTDLNNCLNSNMLPDLCKDMNSYDDDDNEVTDLNNCLNSNMFPDLCKDADEITNLNNCLNSNILTDSCNDLNMDGCSAESDTDISTSSISSYSTKNCTCNLKLANQNETVTWWTEKRKALILNRRKRKALHKFESQPTMKNYFKFCKIRSKTNVILKNLKKQSCSLHNDKITNSNDCFNSNILCEDINDGNRGQNLNKDINSCNEEADHDENHYCPICCKNDFENRNELLYHFKMHINDAEICIDTSDVRNEILDTKEYDDDHLHVDQNTNFDEAVNFDSDINNCSQNGFESPNQNCPICCKNDFKNKTEFSYHLKMHISDADFYIDSSNVSQNADQLVDNNDFEDNVSDVNINGADNTINTNFLVVGDLSEDMKTNNIHFDLNQQDHCPLCYKNDFENGTHFFNHLQMHINDAEICHNISDDILALGR